MPDFINDLRTVYCNSLLPVTCAHLRISRVIRLRLIFNFFVLYLVSMPCLVLLSYVQR